MFCFFFNNYAKYKFYIYSGITIILKKKTETIELTKKQSKQALEENNRLTTKRKHNFDAEPTKEASTSRESKRLKPSLKSRDKENAPPSHSIIGGFLKKVLTYFI